MIELRLLGTISLIGSDGEQLPAILRQPKRLEVRGGRRPRPGDLR
jgi:hypothetical protein